jgi:endonuclease G, mitochondrial
MSNQNGFTGYKTAFLPGAIELPDYSSKEGDVVDVEDGQVLNYMNYSVVLSSSRKFPFFTASNIDGQLFKKAPRNDNWRVDDRAAEFQWGPELYRAEKSDFDRGHMTKREDVQWGHSIAIARKAADSTFFYSNAVPQHAKLNQQIWRSLEDYVLHTETRENGLKICVFTGPVLGKNDPVFVTPVNDEKIKIPILFWKVIYFPKSDGKIYRVGFMMSQSSLLKANGIVREMVREAITDEDRLFLNFEEADTYQVNISTIEKLTGLVMPVGIDVFVDERSIKLILEEIDVRESLKESANIFAQIGFTIKGISL